MEIETESHIMGTPNLGGRRNTIYYLNLFFVNVNVNVVTTLTMKINYKAQGKGKGRFRI